VHKTLCINFWCKIWCVSFLTLVLATVQELLVQCFTKLLIFCYSLRVPYSVGLFGVLGMTMVKFGKGEENSPVDFIATRRAALERYWWLYCCAKLGASLCLSCKLVLSVVFSRYLNRVARHPILREDPDFILFLEADVVWTSCLSHLHVCTVFYILYMQLHGLVDQWCRCNVMLHISRSGGSLPAIDPYHTMSKQKISPV